MTLIRPGSENRWRVGGLVYLLSIDYLNISGLMALWLLYQMKIRLIHLQLKFKLKWKLSWEIIDQKNELTVPLVDIFNLQLFSIQVAHCSLTIDDLSKPKYIKIIQFC